MAGVRRVHDRRHGDLPVAARAGAPGREHRRFSAPEEVARAHRRPARGQEGGGGPRGSQAADAGLLEGAGRSPLRRHAIPEKKGRMSGSMKGKVAWITGGGSGIGLAGGLEFARAGAHVVLSGRSADTLKKAEKELKAAGSGEAIALDVANQQAVAHTAKHILERHGRIDILVNSAGINSPKRNFRDVAVDSWDQIVAINLSGMFYCCHAVLPAMRELRDGLIINVASWAGRYASALTGPAYNATKSAVVALTESINIEECMNGIRASSVLPGEVATPILEKRPVPPSQEERARMLQAEDLGRAVLFIATLPPRACVNEILISPTWNRFYLGGLESPKN